MGTKMKGLLKGLRYISQIFDNEKEQDIQIGYPTDVKHVAHIGWDGPSTVHSPSWMDEFRTPGFSSSSEPHNSNEDASERGNQELPEAPKSLPEAPKSLSEAPKSLPEAPKSSRRQSSAGTLPADSNGEGSNKPRRRNQSASAASSPGREPSSSRNKPTRQPTDQGHGSDAGNVKLPDIPKKSRRKKSKDCSGGGGSTRARTRSQQAPVPYSSPFSDPGTGSGSGSSYNDKELCPKSPLKRIDLVEGRNCNVRS